LVHRASRANYPSTHGRSISLLLAGLLVVGFAAIFYFNKSESDVVSALAVEKINPSVEKIIVEHVATAREQKTPAVVSNDTDNFTFYKTLTHNYKKPAFDPSTVLKREESAKIPIRETSVSKSEPDKPDNENPRSDLNSDKNSSYSIQLASLSDFSRAENLAKELEGKGYKTFIIASNAKTDKGIYKVRTGKYKDLAEAKAQAAKLNSKENLTAFVVKE
jgi:cell division septation protein DedD